MKTPAMFRRMKLGQSQDRVGQFRQREALPAAWWRQLAELALLLILVGILTQGCGVKVPPVLTSGYEQLEQQLNAAKAAVEAACATGESDPCTGARQLVAELQGLLQQLYPNGRPTPDPTSPPVTQPPSTPPTTTPQEPPTPPPAEGCVLAGEPSQALPASYQPKHQAAVLAAIRRAHPSCTWGDCLINEETQQSFQAKVEAEVRKGGKDPNTGQAFEPLCAGQHRKSTDEIAVSSGPKEPEEGYDVFTGDDSELVPNPGYRRTIVWAVYRGTWYAPGTEPGTPDPTPSPSAACPAPRPETYRNPVTKQDCTWSWGYGEKPAKWRDTSGNLVWGLDATLTVARCCDFCKAIGMGEYGGQIRCQCPLRSEGQPEERELCEAEVGATWQARNGSAIRNPGNRAQGGCDGSGCEARVCTGDLSACGDWRQP